MVYKRDAATDTYKLLSVSDQMAQGRGYWIKVSTNDHRIDIDGDPTVSAQDFETPLVGSSGPGRWNLVGHPFVVEIPWADSRFVDASGTEWTPSEAEAQGVASKSMYTWNGSAYQTWDDVTPGMLGTLGVFEGQWVKAFATATALRIPAMPASGGAAPVRNLEEGEWLIRLTATSGDLSDPGNVFGQLAGSKSGLDVHDLPERAPFNADYLTVVFPHPRWQTEPWAYTTDFHGIVGFGSPGGDRERAQRWRFEIRRGTAGGNVVLSWQGPAEILQRSILVDLTSGRKIRPKPGGSLDIEMTTPIHRFKWIVLPVKGKEEGLR